MSAAAVHVYIQAFSRLQVMLHISMPTPLACSIVCKLFILPSFCLLERPITYAGILQTFEWLSSAGAWACAQLLKSTSASSQSSSLSASLYSDRTATLLFCNAWCLHEAAKAHIPLEDRCLDLELLEQSMHSRTAKTLDVDISASASATSIPEQQTTSQPSADAYKALLPFMDCWCSSVHKLLVQEVLSGQLDETDQLRLADIVDGRLWHVMACSLLTATPVGLAPTALQTAAQLMHAICQLADVSPQSAVLFTSMQRPSAVAKDTQQQTIKVVDQSSPLQLVLRHSVHHNSFVDAFLGPQPAHEQGQELQSDDGSIVAVFGEAYHWHTGRPLEPTYLGECGHLIWDCAACCRQGQRRCNAFMRFLLPQRSTPSRGLKGPY